jgi:uncharacterized protein (DUF2267 family)
MSDSHQESDMNYHDMMRAVAGRTGLTRRGADQAVLTTLTVLAESVSAQETRDLLAQLPKSFRDRVPVSGEKLAMRPIEFIARVADLNENASLDETEAQVRAVFATLSDAVNRGEMNDIAQELGADFDDLLGRRARVSEPELDAEPDAEPDASPAHEPAWEPPSGNNEAQLPRRQPAATAPDAFPSDPTTEPLVHQPLAATVAKVALRAAIAVPRVLFGLVRLPAAAAVRVRRVAAR